MLTKQTLRWMAAVRCHRTQKLNDEPRGAPGRYLSRGVLQMAPGSIQPQPCGSGGESGDGEEGEVISEAQRQLKELLKKQLDTSDMTVKGALERKKAFTPAVLYQPLSQEVRGLRSLEQYQRREEDYSRLDQLRQLGLTPSEIELKLSGERCTDGEPVAKKHRFEPDPKAQQDRIQALHEKITEKEKRLEEPVVYSGVKSISRHAMEIERSLFREATGGNPLCHLTVQGNKSNNMAYPTQIMPEVGGRRDSKKTAAAKVNNVEVSQPAVGAKTEEEEMGGAGIPLPVPVEVIERNRLTLAEILTLPRFRDYKPGEPSKVLFLKNLHPRVSEDDLLAVFGYFRARARYPRVRVLVGKMRGQAFVEFDDIETATKALQLVNGYIMQDKPVIITYGRGNSRNR